MSDKKIGILTFHAAHNYGSVLQAYALQKTIERFDFDCEIINFRTEAQKDQYRPLTKRRGAKYIIKNAYFLLNYKSRKKKHDAFEKFIASYLKKSAVEYTSLEQLQTFNLHYTHYISGSDQIWNTAPNDASMAYFLPFVKDGIRIAYAPSFGQIGNVTHRDELAEYLKEYDYMSVREENGQKIVADLIGKDSPILVDPTMLLTADDWKVLLEKYSVVDREYIFFYTLFANKEMIQIAKVLSRKLRCKVVISNISNQYEIFNSFVKKTASGPLDFLNLIFNAKFVLTSSFHGTVFSIIFEKPFLAIDGMKDKRISTLLRSTGLENRTVSHADELTNMEFGKLLSTNFDCARKRIKEEQMKSISFLQEALK